MSSAPDEARFEHLSQELALPLPHPDAASLAAMSARVAQWSAQHFSTLPEQPLGAFPSRRAMETLLREPLPEKGSSFQAVFDEFLEKIVPNVVQVSHPRFLAFIPGSPSYVSMLGDWLCSSLNCFAGVWMEAAAAAQVELLVLDWLKQMVGYPAGAEGLITSGGSEATLTALVAAREHLSQEEQARALLYVSEQRHWSVDRAAKIIGLRSDQVRIVPSRAYLFDPQALSSAAQRDRQQGLLPWAVVASAGATNTGAVDPLAALADVCQAQRLWLHADAAYGWAAVLTDEGRHILCGLERADSITLDPHKWLAQTFDAGCLLVREGRRLAATFAMLPEYMQDVEPTDAEINFCDRGLALTRRFRALKIWLSLKVLGVGWFRALVERDLRLAELTERALRRHAVFEVLSPRQLSIVCFRYVPAGVRLSEEVLDRINSALAEELRATGRFFLSTTRLHEHTALRCCFVSWRTTSADVHELLAQLLALGARVTERIVPRGDLQPSRR